MDDPQTPSRRCEHLNPGGRCRNWAVGGDWCRLHDPALADKRKANGRVRKLRFSTGVRVDGVPLDRATVPATARVVDLLLDVADDIRSGDLEAKDGQAITSALKAALDGLWKEREWTAAQKPGSGAGHATPPPWMQKVTA
jgi:hypothetical protein